VAAPAAFAGSLDVSDASDASAQIANAVAVLVAPRTRWCAAILEA
jgi:hypothetical protein